MIRRLTFAAVLLLLLVARPAVANSCSAFTSNVSFGNYYGATVDVTGTVTVTCTNGQAYDVGLSAGLATGATVTNRSMTTGPVLYDLGYQLFSNAARTNNWGNTSGTGWVAGTGTGTAQTYTIYAQIPAGEAVGLGSYTDTITYSVSGTGITTVTGEFGVLATVVAGCTVSATNLAFGNYTGAVNNSTSTLSVICTSGTTYTVSLNAGLATGATVTNRSMTGPGSALLRYSLFSNSTRTTNWGNSSATNWVNGTGNGTTQPFTVYGQIPAGQYVKPGSYTDTITVSVAY